MSCLSAQGGDPFDIKGIVKYGKPKHHGRWHTQKPEFHVTETDYFGILHPICKKSPREDKKGAMEVNGLWIDDCGRIVLSLECTFCGARNALKPFTESRDIPLLNESGAQWERVESPIWKIIQAGEGHKIEFKSSLRWDYEKKQSSRDLEYEVARAIAAFLNTDGGVLLIGISDFGETIGIEKDLKTLQRNKKNKDGFELQFNQVLDRYFELKNIREFIEIEFHIAGNVEICLNRVFSSSEPVFLKKGSKAEFIIRSGNRSLSLDPQETVKYCQQHWDN